MGTRGFLGGGDGILSEPDSRKEVEVVLMIVSNDPRAVAEKVAMLDTIAGYRLSRQTPSKIHDVYFDTSDGRLKQRRVNLRVRHQDSGYWLTMKRSPGPFTWRKNERQELEVPWSQSSLNRILEELARQGVKLTSPKLTSEADPVEVLKSTGLLVTQDRETRRETSKILPERGEQEPLAELAVDSVQYNLATQTVSLCEVEVEAKSSEGRNVLGSIKKSLLERFGTDLRPWKYGKLVTGKAVRRLLEEGELQSLIEEGFLKPEAFEKIDRAVS